MSPKSELLRKLGMDALLETMGTADYQSLGGHGNDAGNKPYTSPEGGFNKGTEFETGENSVVIPANDFVAPPPDNPDDASFFKESQAAEDEKILYHGTSSIYADAIRQHGLEPHEGKVYVTGKHWLAATEAGYTVEGDEAAGFSGVGGDPVIVVLDGNHPSLQDLKLDNEYHFEHALFVTHPVPSDAILRIEDEFKNPVTASLKLGASYEMHRAANGIPARIIPVVSSKKPHCPNCGSTEYALMPTDFETAECSKCGTQWDHGIVPGINDPYEKAASVKTAHKNFLDPGEYDEKEENHIREEVTSWAQYAEPPADGYDPTGTYFCGSCNMRRGENECQRVDGPISFTEGSCRLYQRGNPTDQPAMEKKFTQQEAKYGENPEGFGCVRCEYGSLAKSEDSKGRPSWCSFWGMHVLPKACCGQWEQGDPNEGADKKSSLVKIKASAEPKVLYHVTAQRNRESIQKHGIDPKVAVELWGDQRWEETNKKPGFFAFAKLSDARWFAKNTVGPQLDMDEDVDIWQVISAHPVEADTTLVPKEGRDENYKPSMNRSAVYHSEPVPASSVKLILSLNGDEKWVKHAASQERFYHVTKTENVPSIRKKGITQLNPSNWVKGIGERYGEGEIFAFTNANDAVRWAAKMDWDTYKSSGTGKISIVVFIPLPEQKWEQDTNDSISQVTNKGRWVKLYGFVPPEQITSIVPVTTDMIRDVIQDRPIKLGNTKSYGMGTPIGGTPNGGAWDDPEEDEEQNAQMNLTSSLHDVSWWMKSARPTEQKIELLQKQLNLTPEQIELCIEADPSPQQKDFVAWIAKWLVKGQIRLPEDTDKLKKQLGLFQKLKKSPAFQGEKDIQKYDPSTLFEVVETNQNALSKKEKARNLVLEGSAIVVEDGDLVIYKVWSPAALMQLSGGTNWCTAHNSHSTRYLKQGPSYVFFKDGSAFAQLHPASDQLMNRQDSCMVERMEDSTGAEIAKFVGDPTAMRGLRLLAAKESDVAAWVKENATEPSTLAEVLNRKMQEEQGQGTRRREMTVRHAMVVNTPLPPDQEAKLPEQVDVALLFKYGEQFHARTPWKPLEKAVLKEGPNHIVSYTRYFLNNQRWPKGEKLLLDFVKKGSTFIQTAAEVAVDYAEGVIQGRWPELEKIIADLMPNSVSGKLSAQYALKVLKKPWTRIPDIPHGGFGEEKLIKANPVWLNQYSKQFMPEELWDDFKEKLLDRSGLDDANLRLDKDLWIVREWEDLESCIRNIGDHYADEAFDYAIDEEAETGRYGTPPSTHEMAKEIAANISVAAMKRIGLSLQEEESELIQRWERQNNVSKISFTNADQLASLLVLVEHYAPQCSVWRNIRKAYEEGQEAQYRDRRIGDLSYAITNDMYEREDREGRTIYTELRFGPDFGTFNDNWQIKPVYEVLPREGAVQMLTDITDENPERPEDVDISQGQLEIIMMEPDYSDSDRDSAESYDLMDKWYTMGEPRQDNRNQMQLQFQSSLLQKRSQVDMHETPTMLPPREDMRRHIDQAEQDAITNDVMQGVKPQAPAMRPQQSKKTNQIDPNLNPSGESGYDPLLQMPVTATQEWNYPNKRYESRGDSRTPIQDFGWLLPNGVFEPSPLGQHIIGLHEMGYKGYSQGFAAGLIRAWVFSSYVDFDTTLPFARVKNLLTKTMRRFPSKYVAHLKAAGETYLWDGTGWERLKPERHFSADRHPRNKAYINRAIRISQAHKDWTIPQVQAEASKQGFEGYKGHCKDCGKFAIDNVPKKSAGLLDDLERAIPGGKRIGLRDPNEPYVPEYRPCNSMNVVQVKDGWKCPDCGAFTPFGGVLVHKKRKEADAIEGQIVPKRTGNWKLWIFPKSEVQYGEYGEIKRPIPESTKMHYVGNKENALAILNEDYGPLTRSQEDQVLERGRLELDDVVVSLTNLDYTKPIKLPARPKSGAGTWKKKITKEQILKWLKTIPDFAKSIRVEPITGAVALTYKGNPVGYLGLPVDALMEMLEPYVSKGNDAQDDLVWEHITRKYKQADDPDESQFLQEKQDAEREAYKYFLTQDYLQQEAAERRISMRQLWNEMKNEFMSEYFQIPYWSERESKVGPEFRREGNCPKCKTANTQKVYEPNEPNTKLAECKDCGLFFVN